MPSRWLVALRKLTHFHSELAPKSVHSLVSTWLDRRPGSLEGVDHWDLQPYSVSWPQESGRHVVLSLGLVVDGLEDVLLSRAEPGAVVRWNRRLARLVPDDSLWIERVTRVSHLSFDEVLGASRASSWRITHDSPATHQRWSSRYECLHGVQDLLSRPNTLYGALTDQAIASSVFDDKLMLERVELQSVIRPIPVAAHATQPALRMRSGLSEVPKVHGTLGWSEWSAQDRSFCPHVDAVLRIAEFSGVGHFTSAGFGAVTTHPLSVTRQG